MAENEELRLTVSIDDRATAQLQALRGQLSSMGSGAQAAGMERMRRQSAEVGVSVGGLSEAMRGMATRAGVVGGVVGAITGKLIDLGTQFVARATDVKAYSEALLRLHNNAQLAGTSAAQFQSNMSSMRESAGVGAEQAAASLAKFSEVQVDLQRQNSKTRQALMEGLKPEDRAAMGNLLAQVAQADVTEAANIWLRGADRIEQNLLRRGDSPALAAQARARWLARGGLPENLPTGFQFAKVSPEDTARENARKEAAAAYRKDTEETASAYDRIVKSATAILLTSEGTGAATGIIRDNMRAAATAAEQLEDRIRKANEAANKAAPQPGATGQPGDEWWRRFDPTDPRNVAREKAAREAAGLPPLQQPAPQQPEGRPDQAQRLREFNERERLRLEQEERDRGPPPAPTGPTRPSAPVERAPGAAPIRIPPSPSAALPPPPELAAPDEAEQQRLAAEEARRQAQLLRRRAAAGAIAPPAPPPAVMPQRFTGGEISTTMPLPAGGFVPDPNFLAGREQGLGTAGGGIDDRRLVEDQTAQTRALTDELQRLNTAMRERDAAKPEPPAVHEPISGATLGLDAIGTQPPPIVVPPPQAAAPPIVVPFAQRFGEWPQPPQPGPWVPPDRGGELAPQEEGRAPPPSAFEGNRIGLMGGPAMDQAQAAQAMDTKALDRAAARDVNVNGTGKISVDVRAPAGTNVKAQGQGLFKRTEITRQTQMMPAEYGPAAATGVGAAEG